MDYKLNDYRLGSELIKFLSNYIIGKDGKKWDGTLGSNWIWKPGKAIWIYGPTGIGKTGLIVTILSQMGVPFRMINEIPDGLREYDKNDQAIIIDDARGVSELGREVLISLTDGDVPRQIGIKHSTVTLSEGVQVIFLANYSAKEANKYMKYPELKRRYSEIELEQSLIEGSVKELETSDK